LHDCTGDCATSIDELPARAASRRHRDSVRRHGRD
jgi:hypothetical protein